MYLIKPMNPSWTGFCVGPSGSKIGSSWVRLALRVNNLGCFRYCTNKKSPCPLTDLGTSKWYKIDLSLINFFEHLDASKKFVLDFNLWERYSDMTQAALCFPFWLNTNKHKMILQISLVFVLVHNTLTTYSWNIKWKKCAGISGLWVLIEIIQKIHPENMKKFVGAVWKLPAK